MNPVTKEKLTKKVKQSAEFGAENIDNTAPIKKIIGDIYNKNSQALDFYCYTVRQIRQNQKKNGAKFHYFTNGHPMNAFSDDWDGGLNSGYFETFPFKSLMPKYKTNITNFVYPDPVTEALKLKKDWHQKCANMKAVAARFNLKEKYEILNEEVVRCPKHFVDWAIQLDSDPLPHFDSTYNWYYAGNGNLQMICVNWVEYLLHSRFTTMYVTEFSKKDLNINSNHEATFDCGEGNNILETLSSSQNILALRTKTKIFILKIVSLDSQIQIEKLKVVETELTFTSISFDNCHKNILYVTTLDNNLTIVNIDRLKGKSVKLKSKNNSLLNNWSTVIGSGRTSYTHVAKGSITTYDKRTNSPSYVHTKIKYVSDYRDCADITAAKQFEDSPKLYIGTNHNLFLMDMRNTKPVAVQRWNHGMISPPTYMSMCNFEYNKEIICLCSQWCEDMCVVPSYADRLKTSDTVSVTTPYRPTSVLRVLNEARINRLCLDIYNPIDTRLRAAITGNTILEQGENYVVLMLNSFGDISCHTLYPEHMEAFVEDDSIQHLHEWAKSYKTESKLFEVSGIHDISNVWKKLMKVPDGTQLWGDKLLLTEECKFDENEIFEVFENEQLESGLLDTWMGMDEGNETMAEEPSLGINIYYSGNSDSD